MKIYHNTITLHAIFGNMYRPRHVLLVLRDPAGHYLLGVKPEFYPPGIVRFVGGGVDEAETPEQAMAREIKEELSISVPVEGLIPIAQVITQGSFEGRHLTNTTFLFEHTINDISQLHPGDDVAALETLDRSQLQALVERYRNLDIHQWYVKDDYKHNWHDYGEMYAFIHQIALDETN
jgi:8-oxo-dGTP pyrophosphatase MutT (NUDIX family)